MYYSPCSHTGIPTYTCTYVGKGAGGRTDGRTERRTNQAHGEPLKDAMVSGYRIPLIDRRIRLRARVQKEKVGAIGRKKEKEKGGKKLWQRHSAAWAGRPPARAVVQHSSVWFSCTACVWGGRRERGGGGRTCKIEMWRMPRTQRIATHKKKRPGGFFFSACIGQQIHDAYDEMMVRSARLQYF